jgi:hypothetical protein
MTLEGDLQIGYEVEKMDRRVINMLIFYCNRCNEMITGGDYESTDQIVDRLDEHIKKCPPATFAFEGTTGVATQRLDAYDHSMRVSGVQVRYGYTDHLGRS